MKLTKNKMKLVSILEILVCRLGLVSPFLHPTKTIIQIKYLINVRKISLDQSEPQLIPH